MQIVKQEYPGFKNAPGRFKRFCKPWATLFECPM